MYSIFRSFVIQLHMKNFQKKKQQQQQQQCHGNHQACLHIAEGDKENYGLWIKSSTNYIFA